MDEEIVRRLTRTTLTSDVLTHCRLKHFASIANTSEDYISRLAIGLSVRHGPIDTEWNVGDCSHEAPPLVSKPKSIRCSTMIKNDLLIFAALISQHQQPEGYESWRTIFQNHWERGVEILTIIAEGNADWIRVLNLVFTSKYSLTN